MDDMFSSAFGGPPNGEFLIDPEGKIVRQKFWSNPQTLRSDLIKFVGDVENPTAAADALPPFEIPKRDIASGVVPRISLPSGLLPLVLKPMESEFPAFAKLRIEGTSNLLGENQKGLLFVGVYLDPIYKVHWNNRAGKVQVKINTPAGMNATQSDFESPEVKENADIDPRQFLLELDRAGIEKPVTISVTYTVCDDAETFCQTVTQDYEVEFRSTRELGSRPGVFMPGMFARTADLDRNGDGIIKGDEFPENEATIYLSHMDSNLDGEIDTQELQRFMKLFNDGRGFDSIYDDGRGPRNK